jgi:hypothetical protein
LTSEKLCISYPVFSLIRALSGPLKQVVNEFEISRDFSSTTRMRSLLMAFHIREDDGHDYEERAAFAVFTLRTDATTLRLDEFLR